MSYVPLHVYSGYSFLKSGLKIEQYLSEAKKRGMEFVGLSDFSSFTGAPLLYHEAEKLGIKVILGEDLIIDNLLFSFYVLNEKGYQNLLKLSLLVEEGKATSETILDYNDGLAIILTTQNDLLKQSLLSDLSEFTRKMARLTKGYTNFYLGLEVTSETEYVKTLRDFSYSHGYKLIAFPSIKYIKKEDAIVLEMMRAIETKEVLSFKKLDGNEYLKTEEEIESFYNPEEISLTNELARMVDFSFIAPRGKTISWYKETGKKADEVLEELSIKGLKEKGKTNEKYMTRISFELETIKKMGYSDYFLIVQDYINFAKSNNIAVGTLVKVVFDSFCDGEIDAYSADYLDDGRLEINTNDKFTTDITNSTELTISFDYQGSEKTFVFDVGDVDFMIYPEIVYIE